MWCFESFTNNKKIKQMRKILQLAGFLSVFAFGTVNAQTYLTENFDGAFTGIRLPRQGGRNPELFY